MSFRSIEPPSEEKGWDAADAINDGYDVEEILEHSPEPFRPLGHNKGTYYFMTNEGKQVLEFTSRSLDARGLMALADLTYWEREYPNERGFTGKSVNMAANALIRRCYKAGIFRPDLLRGRGAWWDNNEVVMHAGNHLNVAGRVCSLSGYKSQYIYEASTPLKITIDNPLPSSEAHKLLDLCQSLSWERPIYARLLAGWCVVAPVCGALEWRPHIWVTSPAGSGKSWIMDNIIRKCLGDIGLVVQGRTTEAGLRQTLGLDARPVLFDEAESEDSRASVAIDNVMALMRQASSETGGKIIKGTTHGKAMSFSIRSCFAFSSIGMGLKNHADATRVTVLSLIKDNTKEAQEHFANIVKPMAHDLLTPEFCERLQARTIKNIHTLRHNTEIFASAASEHLNSKRLGDQIGALLAGAYLLHSSKAITLEDARKWVSARDWSDQTNIITERDEYKLLDYLMQWVIRVQGSREAFDRSIAELINIARSDTLPPDDKIDRKLASEVLARHGIKADFTYFYISTGHAAIKYYLKDTQWYNDWGRILRRIDGADSNDMKPVRFGPQQSKAVRIPLNTLDGTSEVPETVTDKGLI